MDEKGTAPPEWACELEARVAAQLVQFDARLGALQNLWAEDRMASEIGRSKLAELQTKLTGVTREVNEIKAMHRSQELSEAGEEVALTAVHTQVSSTDVEAECASRKRALRSPSGADKMVALARHPPSPTGAHRPVCTPLPMTNCAAAESGTQDAPESDAGKARVRHAPWDRTEWEQRITRLEECHARFESEMTRKSDATPQPLSSTMVEVAGAEVGCDASTPTDDKIGGEGPSAEAPAGGLSRSDSSVAVKLRAVALAPSVWDSSLLIGKTGAAPGCIGWALMVLLMNAVVQISFASVVMSKLTHPKYTDHVVARYRVWRVSIGQNVDNLDLVDKVPLAACHLPARMHPPLLLLFPSLPVS